eukprot:1495224-Rhodomonas_salina.2
MKEYPALKSARGKIDKIYLDTTYCHPKHQFQPQEASVAFIADSVAAAVNGTLLAQTAPPELELAAGGASSEPAAGFEATVGAFEGKNAWRTLVLLSAYKIGKERVLLQVARTRSALRLSLLARALHRPCPSSRACVALSSLELALRWSGAC